MKNHLCSAFAALIALFVQFHSVSADVILTFDTGFEVGDGIVEINALTQLSGVDVTAIANELPSAPRLQVSTDPNSGSNQVLSSATHPDGADILFNFESVVTFVQVEFVNNPGGHQSASRAYSIRPHRYRAR